VQAATAISSWAGIPDLIPESKIIDVFNDKSSRKKDRNTAESVIIDVDKA
jgi:hypothetical protein